MDAPRGSKRRRTSSAASDLSDAVQDASPAPIDAAKSLVVPTRSALNPGVAAASTPPPLPPLRDVRSPSAYPYSDLRGSPSRASGAASNHEQQPSLATTSPAPPLPSSFSASTRRFASPSSSSSSSTAIGNLHHYQQHSHSRGQGHYAAARSPSASTSLSQAHHGRTASSSYSSYQQHGGDGGGGSSNHNANSGHLYPRSRSSHAAESFTSRHARPSLAGSAGGHSSYNGSKGAAAAAEAEEERLSPARQYRIDSGSPPREVATAAAASTSSALKAERTATPLEDASFVKPETPLKPEPSNEKPRGGQACLECRLAKVRCLASADSESCQRCHRFGFDCLFVQHKRGRKPKSKLQGRDLTLLAEAASATPASSVDHQSAQTGAGAGTGMANGSGVATPSGKAKRPESSAVSAKAAARSSPVASPSSATPDMGGRPSKLARTSTLDRTPSARSSPRFEVSFEDHARGPSSSSSSRFAAAAGGIVGPEMQLDPKQLYGVDVGRMARAMQQAMTSQDRRRGAPYTLVTNAAGAGTVGAGGGGDDDELSDAGTPPPPDTNAINESFELIAEQPLTIRLMLKPFEIADGSPDETLRPIFDDRVTIGACPQQREVRVDDPITAGTLTEAAARALFERYMDFGNTWSDVFDPSLMTHDFVRKRSPFLYTTLLYVASTFSRTPTAQHLVVREKRGERVDAAEWAIAYPADGADRSPQAAADYARHVRQVLHGQVRDHAARAFVDGDRTVLCCQAFFIMASWKRLDDGLSVIQVGYAFRLAMDIQLYADMPNCVKPSESVLDQAGQQRYAAVRRRFRSRQRTFMMLFVQDKTQQIANKITTHSISPDNPLIRKCQEWWKYDGAVPGDAFVCASVDVRRIQHKYVDLMDRVEQLSGPMSDGPSIVLPAFLNDIAEWFQRWTGTLNVRKDLDEVAYDDDPAVNRAKFRRTSMKVWRDCLKMYVASLALKWTLKKVARLEHQEMVRAQARRSMTAGTEDRESISGRSSIMQNGCVNLMTMNAFWPCVEGARGVLEALISFEPERLQTIPDATALQSTHAAVLLCNLATIRSHPPLGQGYLRTTIELVDQMSAAFRAASVSSDDTTFKIAQYMESLLRPKDARRETASSKAYGGSRSDDKLGVVPPLVPGQPVSGPGSSFYSRGASAGMGGHSAAAGAAGTARSNGWDAPVSTTSQQPQASAGRVHAATFGSGQPYLSNQQHAPQSQQRAYQPGVGGDFCAVGRGVDGGLDTIAAAASGAASVGAGANAQMDIDNLTWPTCSSAGGGGASLGAATTQQSGGWSYADSFDWNSLLFSHQHQHQHQHQQHQQQQQPQSMPLQAGVQPADETLQSLLRFLDGGI